MSGSGFWLPCAVSAVIAYLLGSLNFGIIVSRIYAKDDIRRHGSGNAGMSNMLRTYGKLPAIITAAGDFLKAVAAVLIARAIFSQVGLDADMAGYIAGLFALLGHLYPLYFGFKGGKGVMTALGVIFLVNPLVFAILSVIFVPVAVITRYVSLGSILGAIAFPILTFAVSYALDGSPAVFESVCALITGGLVLYVHRQNIKRLLNGTENRFGKANK